PSCSLQRSGRTAERRTPVLISLTSTLSLPVCSGQWGEPPAGVLGTLGGHLRACSGQWGRYLRVCSGRHLPVCSGRRRPASAEASHRLQRLGELLDRVPDR